MLTWAALRDSAVDFESPVPEPHPAVLLLTPGQQSFAGQPGRCVKWL